MSRHVFIARPVEFSLETGVAIGGPVLFVDHAIGGARFHPAVEWSVLMLGSWRPSPSWKPLRSTLDRADRDQHALEFVMHPRAGFGGQRVQVRLLVVQM